MSNEYNPAELIAVCDGILLDGELSVSEVYALAEWLNNHREACLHWPGNLLVKPLQEVWGDGQITLEELQRIGISLNCIQREWLRRQMPAKQKREYILKPPAIDLSAAQLPQIDFNCEFESASDPDTIYEISLLGPKCSCPDWRSRRSKLPNGHMTRCCKHVLWAYDQAGEDNDWPKWFGSFIGSSVPPHPEQHWFLGEIQGQKILTSSAPKDWANVFAPKWKGGPYDRFGYNVIEQRWAYKCLPDNARLVEQFVMANK